MAIQSQTSSSPVKIGNEANWEVIRLKYGVSLTNEKAPNVFNYVGLENIESWTGRLAQSLEESEGTADTANRFYSGNVLFGKLRPYLAKAFIAEDDGCCTSELLVLEPIAYEPKYLKYVVLTPDFINLVNSSTYGVKMPRASWDFIGNIVLPKPPIELQKKISTFLDRKTAAIDTLIAKKQRLIELLEEKRAALINQAVTRGLNPNVPMKDSGIPWIGEIPEHWEVSRLGFSATSIQTGPFGSQLHSADYVNDGIPTVNPINMKHGKIFPDHQKTVDLETLKRLSRHKLKVGDLVFARRGELGRCGLVDEASEGWLCGTGSMRVRLNQDIASSSYLNLFVSLNGVASWLSLESVGSTMDNLNTGILSRLPVLIPPKSEQLEIVEKAQFTNSQIGKVIQRVIQQIKKLQEYRQSLITAAVTGKLEVGERQKG